MEFKELKELLNFTSPFRNHQASQKLKALAQSAIQLSKKDQLTPERLASFCSEACGYKLLYGTERVTEDVLKALEELSVETKAIQKMKNMQAGEIVNFVENCASEKRPALHTALRDLFDDPQTAEPAQKAAGMAKQQLDQLKMMIDKVEAEQKYDELIMIGIGGSDLGPRAHFYALQSLLKKDRKIHFISNVDPDDAAAVLKCVNLKRSLIVVISKSGTTLETETNEAIVRERYKKAGIDSKEHFISITMPGTPMDDKARYAHTFYVWDWVGGRYSTTSMVGGVMLSFAFGFDVFMQILKGAHDMDKVACQQNLKTNLPLLAALLGIWNHNFLHYPTLAIIPYSEALKRYPAHLQQLDMESNGKLLDQNGKFSTIETGPVIWGEPGTNAQHSFFQLLHQGTATVPVFFIGFKNSQSRDDLEFCGTTSQEKFLANLFAQSLALALGNQPENANQFCPGNRPNHILLGGQLTPYSLGALLSFYENKVAFQGFIWGINSFDQEGVQLGKITATHLLSLFADKRNKTKTSVNNELGSAYLKHLDSF